MRSLELSHIVFLNADHRFLVSYSILSVVRDNLLYLRKLGASGRGSTEEFPVERSPEAPALIRAYALWMSSDELRKDAAKDPWVPSTFVNTHHTILRALDLSRQMCTRVHPRGMMFPLLKSLEDDQKLVQTGQ